MMRSRLVFACARPTLFALEASGCRVCSSLITCWLSIATWMRPGSWAGTEEFSAKKIRVSMRSAGLCRSTGKCLYLRTVPLRLSPRAGGSFYALRRVVPGLSERLLSGFFPANSLHATSKAYKFYVAAARGVALSVLFDWRRNSDESDSKKFKLFVWTQILHKCPLFSQYTPTPAPTLRHVARERGAFSGRQGRLRTLTVV